MVLVPTFVKQKKSSKNIFILSLVRAKKNNKIVKISLIKNINFDINTSLSVYIYCKVLKKINTFSKARVLKRAQIEQPDKVEKEKVQAGQLCCQLANYCKQVENNLQNSIKYLKEALVYTPKDTKVVRVISAC